VEISTGGDLYELLSRHLDELRYIFIVSQVTITKVEGIIALTSGIVRADVTRAEGQKCERCWNYSTHVGESSKYPTVCERCVTALEEIEKEAA
jgi:isoleucyl-tRNA synthetase